MTAWPGCAISGKAAGVYPPEPPFPMNGKGRGDRVELPIKYRRC
ncbi:hypothetical protein BACCAP_04214 [Pseudoflavonifractor capillosus ATCC 29799]|uniref:Uncharacterized protein n=1 Tax=Pseudoflavonifractor capillosus ATCC 29799 TaxID=411467 RepID=A6P147_9FIRM|nr:hypothetical protein BACCAP_04214 [Pseudoflavonifractor capillosus ATCC 29799]